MNIASKFHRLAEAAGPAVKTVEVSVGNVTETFCVRRLTHIEANQLSAVLVEKFDANGKPTGNTSESWAEYARRLVATTLVNEDGSPALDEKGERITSAWVGANLIQIVDKLATEAIRASALTVEDAAKNSPPTAPAASS